jgi:hypothetical protein
MQKIASQNTAPILISNEKQQSTGLNSVDTTFRVDELIGVWAQTDRNRSINLAPEGSYTLDENHIYLTDSSFAFCDQSLLISYYSSGMVKNVLVYSEEGYEDPDADTLYGSVYVIASASGKDASKIIYVDNSCRCPTTLIVIVDPSTINYRPPSTQQPLTNIAEIYAFLENSGEAVSGVIHMSEITGNATLQWTEMMTGTVLIEMEEAEAINDIPGQTQCVISANADSVVGVWLRSDAGEKIGDNLFSEILGNTIDLLSFVSTGTALLVDYYRGGGVINYLTSVYKSLYQESSVSKVIVSAEVNTEKGLSQEVNVTIQGQRDSLTGVTYQFYIMGPVNVRSSFTSGSSESEIRMLGPYIPRMRVFVDGKLQNEGESQSGGLNMTVNGSGYLRLIVNHVYYKKATPTQNFTLSITDIWHDWLNGVMVPGTATLTVRFTGIDF